jgi:hypothetical protein
MTALAYRGHGSPRHRLHCEAPPMPPFVRGPQDLPILPAISSFHLLTRSGWDGKPRSWDGEPRSSIPLDLGERGRRDFPVASPERRCRGKTGRIAASVRMS